MTNAHALLRRSLVGLLLVGLIAPALASAGIVHAQCVGDDVTVECTGVDPDGWDGYIAPHAPTQITVRSGAQVDGTIELDYYDTLVVEPDSTVDASPVVGGAVMGWDATVINAGTLTANGESRNAGVYLLPNAYAQVTNSGTIQADGIDTGWGIYAFGVDGTSQITNSGTIETSGNEAFGINTSSSTLIEITNEDTIQAEGVETGVGINTDFCFDRTQVANSGDIQASGATRSYGVRVYSRQTALTNSGTITATGEGETAGAYVIGGYIVFGNSGTITGEGEAAVGVRIYGSSSAQLTNTGTITGDAAAIQQIQEAGGTSVLNVTNSGTLNGDVQLGGGDDSFTAEDGAVNGTLDGGDDFDTLTFAFDVLDVDYPALAAQIAAASPAGGSLAYGGATYTWLNFEQLINLLNIVASNGGGEVIVSTGRIDDGRLNRLHPAATAIVYPLAEGGVELYTPQGDFALRAAADAVSAALAQAESSGAPVEISARLGLALIAQPDGSLLATGPGYTFTFSPADCGLAS